MPSMTSPPADVSCTVRSRSGPRRAGRRWPGFAAAAVRAAGCRLAAGLALA